jgi:mannose-6-phosphate isomerase-like protein (cupin superfamily)
MNKKIIKVRIPKPIKIEERNWGKEILLNIIPKKISLKKIIILKGKKGGLQYHHKKNECGYIESGKLLIRFDDGNGKLKSRILKKGDVFHFPPGAVHQEEALTKCTIIEASTPHFNDRVRVEKKYGIKYSAGLTSTKKKDVVFK